MNRLTYTQRRDMQKTTGLKPSTKRYAGRCKYSRQLHKFSLKNDEIKINADAIDKNDIETLTHVVTDFDIIGAI